MKKNKKQIEKPKGLHVLVALNLREDMIAEGLIKLFEQRDYERLEAFINPQQKI